MSAKSSKSARFKAQGIKVFRMKVKELREKNRMINAVLPLVDAHVWSKKEFEIFCEDVLSERMYV